MQDAPSLPNDLDACRALVAELTAQLSRKETLLAEKDALLSEQTTAIVDLQATRETLSQKNEELVLTIEKLLARFYARRSERHEDPNQQTFDFGDDFAVEGALADAVAEVEQIVEEYTVRRRRTPRRPRNEQLPAHLERYEVVAPVSEADRRVTGIPSSSVV